MTIEITSVTLEQGIVTITGTDVSEEHMQYIERYRDDGFEEIVKYVFDTHDEREFTTLTRYLRSQRATNGAKTYREALNSIIGTITNSPSGKYRSWE